MTSPTEANGALVVPAPQPLAITALKPVPATKPSARTTRSKKKTTQKTSAAKSAATARKKTPTKAKAKKRPTTRRHPRPWPSVEQLVLGGFTPLLSIVLTRCAGILYGHHAGMAAFAAMLATAILFVSIKHASASIQVLYQLSPRVSILLALVFDLTIIFAELTAVIVPEAGLGSITWTLLIGLGAASAWLNVQYLRAS